MQEEVFRKFLNSQDIPLKEIDNQVEFVHYLEEHLRQEVPTWTLDDLNGASTQAVIDNMIDRGENNLANLQAVARYARAVHNEALYTSILGMLDGCEAMEQLYEKLAMYAGDDLRDIIFEDMPLPPLGLSRREKSRYTFRIISRMERIFEESTTRDIIKDSLRILPDEMYSSDKSLFFEFCQGDIDQFLMEKGKRFINTLESHRDRRDLFFGQEIDEEVIAFVKSNPQIGQGERVGNVIFETKIPYNAKAYLAEKHPVKKGYYACHCPWARESLLNQAFTVSATFCQCSAGFHKKRYEIIFDQPIEADVLQSVLGGDQICQFAIHLPEGVFEDSTSDN